ncbi:helix-turn-helix transcriptional regulator [Georgenia sp. EYE_87]|uniref:winged helix-turn-helix transcriptional regulator n=1 Tax=Georgenia sp. EYE_87 TaxID=2853448 RepID=UPI0020041EC0|nr:helix-turn-helix domain-containing protein [Georgenia sp. EYE_87]MCK6211638.1 helix-turn-helix transcriptional regulator [Georgenia sp. EYE_87]
MGARELPGYCSFTKAIDHLGDRWSLLVVRQLGVFGPLGFNELIRSLPGHISRSVLAERLRRLETLGLVSRDGAAGYRLTDVGGGLMPVLFALRDWAETWLPDDPAMVERDPDVVLGWLAQRVRTGHLPAEPVVLELWPLEHDRRYWLVLQEGVPPYACLTDPLLDAGRYVYLRCSLATLLALARGRQDWPDALADGSLTTAGVADLRRLLPSWFAPHGSAPAGADLRR